MAGGNSESGYGASDGSLCKSGKGRALRLCLRKEAVFCQRLLTCDPKTDFIAKPRAFKEVLLSDLQEHLCSLLLANPPNTESPGSPGSVDFNRQALMGVGHALCCSVPQTRLVLCKPTDCSPPGSSVHGNSQARILEWIAISFSRGSSQPRDQTRVSCIGRRILYH